MGRSVDLDNEVSIAAKEVGDEGDDRMLAAEANAEAVAAKNVPELALGRRGILAKFAPSAEEVWRATSPIIMAVEAEHLIAGANVFDRNEGTPPL